MKKIPLIFLHIIVMCKLFYVEQDQISSIQNNPQEERTRLSKLYNKADSLYHAGDFSLALKFGLKVLDENDMGYLTNETHSLIGKIWYSTKDPKKSIQYLTIGLNGFMKGFDSNSGEDKYLYKILDCNFHLGKSYHALSEKTPSNMDSSLGRKYRDSAKFHYNKVLNSQSEITEIMEMKSSVYNNMSGIFLREGNYSLAEKYAKTAMKLDEKYGDEFDMAANYNLLFNVYYSQGEYEKGKEALFKGVKEVDKLKGERRDEVLASLLLNLSYIHYLQKDYRSYGYQQRAWNLYDSVKDRKTQQQIADIYANRNFDKGIQEGVFREELKRQRAQRNTWFIGIGLTLVIVILGSLLNRYKLKQKNLQLALSKKETESQMEVLNANLKGQEAERKRISQELHDGVLSRLFGSRMGLGYLELDGDQETQKQYENFLDELQNIEKEIRGVSHQLSSDISISDTSFINAVNQLLKEKSNLGNFDFQLKMDDGFSWKELGGVLEMNLFRILQESLQNILKHAQAKQVFVSFRAEKENLLLQIKDDGLGFDTQKKSVGIGLKNIESRVKELKGIFEITSTKNKGTQLLISVPMNETDKK